MKETQKKRLRKRYKKFQNKYNEGDLDKDTKEEINLVLLNGSNDGNI